MCYFSFGCSTRTNRVCWSLWAASVACCVLLCLATYQRAFTFDCVSAFAECRESLMESARAQGAQADALPESDGESFDPQDHAILAALGRCAENVFQSCDVKGSMSFLQYGLASMTLSWIPCIFFVFCAGCFGGQTKKKNIPTAAPAKKSSQKKSL